MWRRLRYHLDSHPVLIAVLFGACLIAVIVFASFMGLWNVATDGENPADLLTGRASTATIESDPAGRIPPALRAAPPGEAPAPAPVTEPRAEPLTPEDLKLREEMAKGQEAMNEGARVPFDSALWMESARLGVKQLRFRMSGDFADTIRLRGMRAAEIERLLGPPDLHGPGGWQYDLGVEPASGAAAGLLLAFHGDVVSAASIVALRTSESAP